MNRIPVAELLAGFGRDFGKKPITDLQYGATGCPIPEPLMVPVTFVHPYPTEPNTVTEIEALIPEELFNKIITGQFPEIKITSKVST